MALGDSYATLPDLKSRLDVPDAADDTRLTEALSVASRGIERFTGRQFNKATTATARVYYPLSAYAVDVDDFHTITDLVIATDPGGYGTFGTLVAAANYELAPLNGIVGGESGWPYSKVCAINTYFPVNTGRASVQVTAQWGWATVPAPVKEACLVLAAEVFKLGDAPFGVAGFGEFGAVRIRQNPKAAEWLTPYRRYPVLVA